MRYILIALSIMLLFSGCADKDKVETATIQAINSNPDAFVGKAVEVQGATVVDVAFLQAGLLIIRMSDPSGSQMAGLYTGDIYLVNAGDAATFEGVIKSEADYGGAHLGSPQIMEISRIKDVVMGGGVASLPGQTGQSGSDNIAQILANTFSLEDQIVTISGTVTGVRHVEQHTDTPLSYVQVDDGSGQIWVSLPKTDVTEGSQVMVSGALSLAFGDPMVLAESLTVITSGSGSPHGDTPAATSAPAVEAGEIEPVEGGYTVEELFAQSDSLNGQEVTVRAKVVKVSGEIFVEGVDGNVWLHIQDGTGDPATKGNDVTVTYSGDPVVSTGDVVTVRGTLGANIDLQAGYHFDVMIQGATIEK